MAITSITYSKTFPTAPFSNEKIGVEMSVDEGQDAKFILDEARKLVHEFHFENNKEMYEQRGSQVVDVNSPDYVKKPMDFIVKGWYDKAKEDGDTEMIEKLEKEFIVC